MSKYISWRFQRQKLEVQTIFPQVADFIHQEMYHIIPDIEIYEYE